MGLTRFLDGLYERSMNFMPQLGPLELVIILVIVLLLFGIGRISKIAGEMGSGVRSFREGLKGPDAEKEDDEKSEKSE